VRDVMTPNPIALPLTATAFDAARAMREADVGDVIVLDGNRVAGIVTDRDLVVRGLGSAATRPRPALARSAVASSQWWRRPTRSRTRELMKSKAIRRLPVVENNRPVGIVSLGDLAIERDSSSALGQISAAPPDV
jgi:CBS domain-containing protein